MEFFYKVSCFSFTAKPVAAYRPPHARNQVSSTSTKLHDFEPPSNMKKIPGLGRFHFSLIYSLYEFVIFIPVNLNVILHIKCNIFSDVPFIPVLCDFLRPKF